MISRVLDRLRGAWRFIGLLLAALAAGVLVVRARHHAARHARIRRHAEALGNLAGAHEARKQHAKAEHHLRQAEQTRAQAQQRIETIKGSGNETINRLVDRWNTPAE